MKFALLLLTVLALLWLLRGSRRKVPPPAAKAAPADNPRQMLACAHCGLHLPRDEALPGRGGVFCGEAHRNAHEQAHPGP
jgi:uncharacterized protein